MKPFERVAKRKREYVFGRRLKGVIVGTPKNWPLPKKTTCKHSADQENMLFVFVPTKGGHMFEVTWREVGWV